MTSPWFPRLSTVCLAGLATLASAVGARADTVTDWNLTAIRATETAGAPVPVQARAMAIVHAAIFDAVNAVERKYDFYLVNARPAPGGRQP